VETHVLLADQHIPFHDKRAVAVAHKIAEAARPDVVWLMGDLLDFAPLSRFRDSDMYQHTVQDELDLAADYLSNLRGRVPNAKLKWILGNHDYRLDKYVQGGKLRSLRNLNLAKELHTQDLGIEFARPRCYLAHGQFVLKHGSRWGIEATKAELRDEGCSGASAHNHRAGLASHRVPGKKPNYWHSVPCLCTLEPEWKKKDATASPWQHGLGVLRTESSLWDIDLIHIHKGKATWRGQEYTA